MPSELLTIVSSVVGSLLTGGIVALIKMWRDIAIIKRDLDGLATIIGTTRSKGKKKC